MRQIQSTITSAGELILALADVPEPEAGVAVTVYSPADAFVVVSVLLYLSCKVTIGGGSNLTAMNSSNA